MWLEIKSNFRKKIPAIKKIEARTDLEAFLIVTMAGDSFIKHARVGSPKKTHRLEKSIGSRTGEGIYERFAAGRGLRIGTKVPYARAVNEGIRKEYPIVPKKAKVLKFVGRDGNVIYRPQVTHPTTTGRFFMNRALIMMRRDIPAIIRKIKAMRR